MTFMDRTQEFNSVSETIRLKQQSNNKVVTKKHVTQQQQKSQFGIAASKIGREIYDTSEKLSKLTTLAKRKNIFDDPAVEIEELTFIIKQNIQNLNKDIISLREFSRGSSNKQNTAHSNTIVTYLNSKLATTAKDFKEILHVRTENLKAQQEKRKRLTGSNMDHALSTPTRTQSESVLYKPYLDGLPESPQRTGGEVAIAMPMMMQVQQEDYISSRASAVENIERTIAELGGIFQQLAALVAEQGDMIQRIETNVSDSAEYVDRGHTQLLKALHNASGSRMLIMKLFLVLIVFAVIFIVFFV